MLTHLNLLNEENAEISALQKKQTQTQMDNETNP